MIGELFILGFHGKKIPSWLIEFSSRYGLGGVILFDYYCQTKKLDNNIESAVQVKELCQSISELPSSPLVFIDQEGGYVQRLKKERGFAGLVSQQQMNNLPEEERISAIESCYSEMQTLGINFNFAPVIDVNYNSSNPNIGKIERSYSESLASVESNALLLNSIAKKNNIGLCLKHYPGIGGATVDSHTDIMNLSDNIVPEQEALFFSLAEKMFGNALLVSHAIVDQWDAENPITISRAAIQRVRTNLPETLIISDDMQMQGLQKIVTTKDATLKALAAGTDMICIGNNLINEEADMDKIAQFCLKSIDEGQLNKDAITDSINRVKKRKERN